MMVRMCTYRFNYSVSLVVENAFLKRVDRSFVLERWRVLRFASVCGVGAAVDARRGLCFRRLTNDGAFIDAIKQTATGADGVVPR